MTISTDSENTFDKIQHPFIEKQLLPSEYRVNISQTNKSYLWQTNSQHNAQWWKVENFPLKYEIEQECPISPFLFNIVLEDLATAIR